MNKLLLSACAAAVIATGASPASADQYDRVNGAGVVIRIGDHYQDDYPYQGNGYGQNWQYDSNNYGRWGTNGAYPNGYGYNYNYGYGNNFGYRGNYGYGNYGNNYGYRGNYGYGSFTDNYGYGGYPMPPGAIVDYLYRTGYSEIQTPQFGSGLYLIRARDPKGDKVKLYFDAYNGRVVKSKHY